MNTREKVFTALETAILNFFVEHSYNIGSLTVNLEQPVNFKYGDVSTGIALKFAKTLEQDPYSLAQTISQYLSEKKLEVVEKIEVAKPGFINIFFTQIFFENILIEILESGLDFGRNNSLAGQKWVVEHTSPNPNKAMHLGHLRNNLVGMNLVRILSWNGATVVSDAVDNNRGIAIAKLMWGFLAHMRKSESVPLDIEHWLSHPDEWSSPAEQNLLPDVFVTKCYIFGEADFKNNPAAEKKIREFVSQWETSDQNIWKLWSHVLTYAYAGMNRTLARLGNHWDKVWHEHEHYQVGKDFVQKGLATGVFRKLEDGAVLTDLASYNLPDTILLKNDGTALYITQDIALTALKKDFYQVEKLVWVVGSEQTIALKQLFAVCEQLGIGSLKDFTHVVYGYVGLKDNDGSFKKMSSRAGTVVLIDEVIDTVRDKIFQRFVTDGKEVSDSLHNLSEKMAVTAVKFSLLKSDRTQDIVFDLDQSIEIKGDSGIYVLYVYVRVQS